VPTSYVADMAVDDYEKIVVPGWLWEEETRMCFGNYYQKGGRPEVGERGFKD